MLLLQITIRQSPLSQTAATEENLLQIMPYHRIIADAIHVGQLFIQNNANMLDGQDIT